MRLGDDSGEITFLDNNKCCVKNRRRDVSAK